MNEITKITNWINAILKSDRESLEKFQNLEEQSNAEYIYEGRIEALESMLEIIKEHQIEEDEDEERNIRDKLDEDEIRIERMIDDNGQLYWHNE